MRCYMEHLLIPRASLIMWNSPKLSSTERMMINKAFCRHLDAQKTFLYFLILSRLEVFFAFLYGKEEDLFNHSDLIICLTSWEIKFHISLLQKKKRKIVDITFFFFLTFFYGKLLTTHIGRDTQIKPVPIKPISKNSHFENDARDNTFYLKDRLGATQEWLIIPHPYFI